MSAPTSPSSRSRRPTVTSPTSERTRTCRRWPSSTGRPSPPSTRLIFGAIALLGAVAWAIIAFFRGETVSAVWFVVAAVCTYVIGYRFYARLIETKIVKPARRQRHPRRDVRQRHRLHADRPAGAVRPSLRRHRRRRPAGRPGAGRADGLPARHDLDHRRRGLRRRRAGLPGAVDLGAAPRPLARPDGPRRARRGRRRRRASSASSSSWSSCWRCSRWSSSTRSPKARGASSPSR